MGPNNLREPLSFDDIDQILKPVTEIRLDNLPPDVLEHLLDHLGLIAHVAALLLNEK